MTNNNQIKFLDLLNIVQLLLALQNFEENKKQTSNDEILKELNKQDDVFFAKIIANQEMIIKELKIID